MIALLHDKDTFKPTPLKEEKPIWEVPMAASQEITPLCPLTMNTDKENYST